MAVLLENILERLDQIEDQLKISTNQTAAVRSHGVNIKGSDGNGGSIQAKGTI